MSQRRFTFATLALFAALAVPASAAEKGVQTDLTSGLNGNKRSRTVAGVQDLGANWMRLTMSWSEIEPNGKGSYSALDRYDTAFANAAATGANVIVTVYRTPQWASGRTDPDSPPVDPQDYADFLRFAATRWGDEVDAWEIWNEQNTSASWSTGPSPSGYAELLKAAYPAVKLVDPSALVVYGGVSHNDYRFIEQSYAAEPSLGEYYDVMATHPYPTAANLPPERFWLDGDGRLAVRSFPAYREVRDVMLANGDDKPLWFTEFGWSTNTLVDQGVSESTQAAYYTRAMQCVEQDPYVEVAIWSIYRNRLHDSNTWLAQLGLVRTDFSTKPAYDAFKSYTPGNTGCTYRYEDPTPLQPDPEPTPEPKPTPTPDLPADDDPADVTQSEDDGIQSSSVRRKVEIELVRLARAGGSKTRNRVLMRVVGVVSHTHRGRVDLHLTCHARGDRDWRRSLTRRLDVSRAGEYGTRIKPRRRAACSMRASYYAFGQRLGRSPVLRFKA
jgi:polysaccharide biosynthesis protein PslG